MQKRHAAFPARALAIGVTLVFTMLVFIDVESVGVKEAFGKMHIFWGFLMIPPLIASHLVRSLRWKLLLMPIVNVPLFHLWRYTTIGLMLNDLIPARVGEAARLWFIRKNHEANLASVAGIALIERIVDGVTMASLFILALFFVENPSETLLEARSWATGIFLFAAFILALLVLFPESAKRFLTAIAARFGRQTETLAKSLLADFFTGLAVIRSPKRILLMLFLTYGVWLVEMLSYWFVFLSFFDNAGYHWAMLAIATVSFMTLLPAAPGYIGLFEFATIIALMQFGMSKSEAFAASVAMHVLQTGYVFTLGFLLLMKERLGLSEALGAIRQALKQSG